MKKAAEKVQEVNADAEKPHATTVTYDGTWMRRGFSSLFGAFVCIDWSTGRVLDVHVSSRYCHGCTAWKAKREVGLITVQEFQDWQERHADDCTVNTTCFAPAMEAEAAVLLWKRSRERNNLEYHTFIGDGDSKSYSAVKKAMPYGDVEVVKEECVGHVQKRVGSRLRTLKRTMKGSKLSDGKPLSGQGRLTDTVIDDLQTYYGIAVRNHENDLQGMAKAIWASLFHRASTDEQPEHRFCPTGVSSWCGWQRQKAGADEVYRHHNSLPPAVVDTLKPIYRDLTTPNLLGRCLRGATQNQNESLNGLIWSFCPKDGFCGAAVVELAAHLAVACFNNGAVSMMAVLREVGCEVGEFTAAQLRREDDERVKKAARKAQEKEKKRRKVRRRRKKGLEEQRLDLEGTTYAPGEY